MSEQAWVDQDNVHTDALSRLAAAERERDALRAQVEAHQRREEAVLTLADWFEAQVNWREWGIHRQIRSVMGCPRPSSSEPVTAGPEDGMGAWFRRTPESLAMLAEEREALAKSEAEHAAGEVTPPAEQRQPPKDDECTGDGSACPVHSPTRRRNCACPTTEGRPAVSTWRDRQGDIWREGDDGLMHTPETAPFSREYVEKKWGPLVLIVEASR